ncbi:MAG: hypothetical protein A07HB70_01436, partial [uncultured archaeon A07HB70]
AATGARQFVVDPAGGWREAEFAATDLVVADPSRLAARVAERATPAVDSAWVERWERADRLTCEAHDAAAGGTTHEGRVLAAVADRAPDPSTVVVSNSMPVRDLDRFGAPSTTTLTTLGNRGASGIYGVVSTALGAGDATTDPLTLVVGDLALYHDANGLLAWSAVASTLPSSSSTTTAAVSSTSSRSRSSTRRSPSSSAHPTASTSRRSVICTTSTSRPSPSRTSVTRTSGP